MINMNNIKNLKQTLGSHYSYSRHLSDRDIYSLIRISSSHFPERTVASLIVGTVKIEATLFKENDKPALCYDVFVKDTPDSNEWIYYDTPSDYVKLDENTMVSVLDRIVGENHLSYTKCCFESLDGKIISTKKKPDNKRA